ncbi:MAG: IS1096 element passenger TnpR family protein [bacterium]|jgi:hypothetical protein
MIAATSESIRWSIERCGGDYPVGYTRVFEEKGNCSPEDWDGVFGYDEFLEAWNDPGHPGHAEMREWGKSRETAITI